ncbi:MAG: thioredoxin-disulfide reductase [Spirochaetales bacterium]|nr:thioredoxin-disulfide reductase [Spirochaetales bacterium]
MEPDRDLIIIGAGAAGLSAAQYGARANLNVLLIEEMAAGGQAMIIDRLENYPGFVEPVTGYVFSQKMEEQARRFGAEILNDTVTSLKKEDGCFYVETYGGNYTSYTVLLATGAKHRTLNIPGEKEFSGKGVSYCATCDGPLFKGKKMFVVGGGDAACDEAMFLAKLSDNIIMVHRRDRFRAQKALAARVLNNDNIEVRFNTELKEIKGGVMVDSVLLYDNQKKSEFSEAADAVFIFIGSEPQTQLVKGFDLDYDESSSVITDQKMQTKVAGLYVAGDVRATPFRQLVVAAGEGAIAAHAASQYIDEQKGQAYL